MTVLLIVSVVMLIILIRRVGMLHIIRMLSFTGDQGRAIFESLYPPIDTPSCQVSAEITRSPCLQTLQHQGGPRSVRKIDRSVLEVLEMSCGPLTLTAAHKGIPYSGGGCRSRYGCCLPRRQYVWSV